MSEKKVVSRTTAIALAVLCIVILMGAVGAVIYFNQTLNDQNIAYSTLQTQNTNYINDHSHANSDWESLKSQLADAQNQLSTANSQSTVSNLQSQIDSLQSQLNSANSQIQSKQSQLDTANSQLATANSINNLQSSSTWVNSATVNQDKNNYFGYTETANYAGYVSVNIQSSTTTNQYVEMIWSSHGVSYDSKITVGTSGTAVFVVLPSSNIQIRIGNTNLLNGATATVTITYAY